MCLFFAPLAQNRKNMKCRRMDLLWNGASLPWCGSWMSVFAMGFIILLRSNTSEVFCAIRLCWMSVPSRSLKMLIEHAIYEIKSWLECFWLAFLWKAAPCAYWNAIFKIFCSFVPMIVRFKNMVGFCSRIKEVEPWKQFSQYLLRATSYLAIRFRKLLCRVTP